MPNCSVAASKDGNACFYLYVEKPFDVFAKDFAGVVSLWLHWAPL